MYTIKGISPDVMQDATDQICGVIEKKYNKSISYTAAALLASHVYLSLRVPIEAAADVFKIAVSRYLQNDLNTAMSPGPLFEAKFVSDSLKRLGKYRSDLNLIVNWLICVDELDVETTPILNCDFYATDNSDVVAAGMNLSQHFILHGVYEGRSPSLICDQIRHVSNFMALPVVEQCHERSNPLHANPYGFQYERFLPIAYNHIEVLSFISSSLSKSLYEIDLTDLAFLVALFDFSAAESGELDEWFDFLATGAQSKPIGYLCAFTKLDEVLHWIRVDRLSRIIPTSFFNEEEYLDINRDVRGFGGFGFEHYLIHGRFEGRGLTTEFNRRWVDRFLGVAKGADGYAAWINSCEENAYLPSVFAYETLRGRKRGDSLKQHWQLALRRSWLGANGLTNLDQAIETGFLHEAIERAARLDPQIESKEAPRMLVVPHKNESLTFLSERLRIEFERVCGDDQPSVVILVPMRGIGGAETVSENLFSSLEKIGLRPLMIITDESSGHGRIKFERQVDLAKICATASTDERVKLLTDMLYGIGCKTILNVNSLVGWEAIRHHGNVLREEFSIVPFLFCWDFDEFGRIQGYISDYFSDCFDYCKTFVFDNHRIKNDLADIYGIDHSDPKLSVLYSTPSVYGGTAVPLKIDALPAYSSKKAAVFWAGRMSRQKRFDLVVSIALQMPDTQFYCWGSSVFPKSIEHHPKNVHMMGRFVEFDEIPIELCGAWLFTSDYEGVPITLIECARNGLPVVASDVGGVSELINHENGWLVSGDEPKLYTKALLEAVSGGRRVRRKSHLLKRKFLENHGVDKYVERVRLIWSNISA